MIVYNEQDLFLAVGEGVVFDNQKCDIESIIPPSRATGKWAIMVVEQCDERKFLSMLGGLPRSIYYFSTQEKTNS